MRDRRILVASPVRQRPDILKEYAESLLNMNTEGFKPDFLFIDDNSDKASAEILQKLTGILSGTLIKGSSSAPSKVMPDTRHKWDFITIQKVSEYRNRILQLAREGDYEGLFFIDSDLLLHPNTLRHLMAQDKAIIAEIYWTRWAPSGPLYPQVWLYDNYTQFISEGAAALSPDQIKSRTEDFHAMLKRPGVYRVGGLGGCMFIGKAVLKSDVSFTKVYNLSFAGEDRHFCVRAAVHGFEMYVDTSYPAYHIYRLSDLPGCKAFKINCAYRNIECI